MRQSSLARRPGAATIARRLALVALLGMAPVACMQPPTSEASVVDQRPGLSFKSSEAALGATVLVDGQQVGTVGQFLEGEGRLRVLPGTHQVRVMQGGAMLIDERVYVADGVNKTIRVD